MGTLQRVLHKLGPVEFIVQDVQDILHDAKNWRQGITKLAKITPCLGGKRRVARPRSQHHRSKTTETRHGERSERVRSDAEGATGARPADVASMDALSDDGSTTADDDFAENLCEIRMWSSGSSLALSDDLDDDDYLMQAGPQCFDMSTMDSEGEEDVQLEA